MHDFQKRAPELRMAFEAGMKLFDYILDETEKREIGTTTPLDVEAVVKLLEDAGAHILHRNDLLFDLQELFFSVDAWVPCHAYRFADIVFHACAAREAKH